MKNQSGVEAQIKADVFTSIFDSMTKNMKQNQSIFFIFNHKQMKLWLCQTSKTTQLQLSISFKAFKSYICNFPISKSIFRKYSLKKFLWFSTFFESCKGIFRFSVTEDRIQFEDSTNSNRRSLFPVQSEEMDQEEEQNLKRSNILMDQNQRNLCWLTFPKSKLIQEVIHSGNAMKVAKVWLTYLTNEKKLRFDFKHTEGPFLKVKALEQKSVGASEFNKIPFPFRKLKLAASLIESQKPFQMSLSKNALMINFDEENMRKYSILVMAEYEE